MEYFVICDENGNIASEELADEINVSIGGQTVDGLLVFQDQDDAAEVLFNLDCLFTDGRPGHIVRKATIGSLRGT
ncbi:MAG: hypothetical protein ACLQU5_12990 [Isosphaeraceae bacterium]